MTDSLALRIYTVLLNADAALSVTEIAKALRISGDQKRSMAASVSAAYSRGFLDRRAGASGLYRYSLHPDVAAQIRGGTTKFSVIAQRQKTNRPRSTPRPKSTKPSPPPPRVFRFSIAPLPTWPAGKKSDFEPPRSLQNLRAAI